MFFSTLNIYLSFYMINVVVTLKQYWTNWY